MRVLLALLLFCCAVVHAEPIQWSVESGGNGHFYEAVLVEAGLSWTDAQGAAAGMGGYLATATSAAENSFIADLVDTDPRYWFFDGAGNGIGPHLGGLQAPGSQEPNGGWGWVTGEQWSYTNWAPGEPNNSWELEDRLQLMGHQTLMGSQWNDRPASWQPPGQSHPKGFTVEWDSNPAAVHVFLVRPDGAGDFPTIQEAINAAMSGDTIELAAGTFTGEGNRDIDFGGKAVTVRSQDGNAETCVIDCGGTPLAPHRGFFFRSGEQASSALAGITITNGYSIETGLYAGGGAISCSRGSPSIMDCVFIANTSLTAGGAILMGEGRLTVTGCRFIENTAQSGGGLICSFHGSADLSGCTFVGNTATNGSGGAVALWEDTSAGTINGCLFADNQASSWGGAVFLTNAAHGTITSSTLVNNDADDGGGICCWYHSALSISRCIVAFGTGGAAVTCSVGGTADLECTDVFGNAGGDWVGAISGQYGISGNISADPLFCHPDSGDFHLFSNSPCAPEQSGECGLIGALPVGCPIVPILVRPDGTGDYPTIQAAVDAAAPQDTVLLTNGRFTGEGNRDLDYLGKAVVIRSQSGIPDSCVIDCEGIEASQHRGFFFHSGEQATSVLAGVTITGGYIASGGGGIRCEGASSPLISNCVLVENISESGGAGADCSDSSASTFENCQFVRNEGVAGGIRCYNANAIFSNCLFSANAGTQAGAIQTWDASPSIIGCTIANNFGGTTSGLLLEAFSSPTIQNSIIAFGENGPAVVCQNSAVWFACSDIYGNQGGDWVGCAAGQNGRRGNFSLDPCFCDAENGDYHLWNYSPCAQEGCGLMGAWPVGCEDPMAVEPEPLPRGLSLSVWPNPVGGAAQIRYALPTPDVQASLGIYDLAGRLIRIFKSDASSSVTWDGTDACGRRLQAGPYFLRLRVGEEEVTRRAVVIR